MNRLLIIETKAVIIVPDRFATRLATAHRPRLSGCALRRLPVRQIAMIEGVLRERMQQIGEHQFLMLLLVMQSDLQPA